MLRPLVRSIVSTLVAACFALSAASWGRPSVCASHTAGAEHHEGSHDRSHDHGTRPASLTCTVHLCCAHHLALQPSAAPAADQFGEVPSTTGLTAATAVAALRLPHTLPFAHAPPLLS
jgi:hypothetical protein